MRHLISGLRNAGPADSAMEFRAGGLSGRTTSALPGLGGGRAEGVGELLLERTKTLQVHPLPNRSYTPDRS